MLQFCFYWPSWKRAFGELQAFVYVFVKKTDVITRVRELSPRQYCQRYASFFFLSNLIHVMSWVSSCIFLVLCLCLIIVRTLVSCVVFFLQRRVYSILARLNHVPLPSFVVFDFLTRVWKGLKAWVTLILSFETRSFLGFHVLVGAVPQDTRGYTTVCDTLSWYDVFCF